MTVQMDHILNYILPSDSTDSSTSTDISDEEVVPINQPNSNNKKKVHNENLASFQQRKKVTFVEEQQSTPQLSINNTLRSEINDFCR